MPRARKPCPDCGSPIRSDARTCMGCLRLRQQAERGLRFEPMAAPPERSPYARPIPTSAAEIRQIVEEIRGTPPPGKEPKGRFFDDPRNGRKPIAPQRLGTFDIETTGLNASFGRQLCVVFQLYAPDEMIVLRADQYAPWKTGDRNNDRELVADTLKIMEDVDILVGHNAVDFDIKFLMGRAVIHNLPPVIPTKVIDPVKQARINFRFHSNKLESLQDLFGVGFEKTPLDPNLWGRAMYNGDAAAMDEIVQHCIMDVLVLEEVAHRIRKFCKKIDQIGSWRG